MIEYAIRLVKNKFYALNLKEGLSVKHGDYVVVMTDKGEEIAKVFKVCSKVSAVWEKNKPEFINVVKVLSKEETAKIDDIKKDVSVTTYTDTSTSNSKWLVMNCTVHIQIYLSSIKFPGGKVIGRDADLPSVNS